MTLIVNIVPYIRKEVPVGGIKQLLGISGLAFLLLVTGLTGQTGNVPQTKKETIPPQAKDRPGEQKTSPRAGQAEEEAKLEIIRARYVRAAELAPILSSILPVGNKINPLYRLAVDDRANSLVVSAPPAVLKQVLDLVEQLDVRAALGGDDGQKLVAFPLQNLKGDNTLTAALSMLLEKNPRAKYTFDPARNALLLYCDDKTQAEVSDLLKVLTAIAVVPKKATTPPEPLPAMQVRVMWLVDEQGPEELAGDVTKVIPTLAKLGIKHPRVASNCLVNVKSGSFQISGRSPFNGNSQIRVIGSCRLEGNTPLLKIDLRVDSEKKQGTPPVLLSTIETEIQAPFGHFVILGMTPSGETTSVFVVQVNQLD